MQYLSSLLAFIPVTLQLVADVLRVSRIEFPDYPSCERLRTVSKDELMAAFYEHPSNWGDHQFTPYRPFAKSPKFIKMMMTFVLYPLTITPSQSLVLGFCYLFFNILL